MSRPTPIALLLALVPGLATAGGMLAGATGPRPPVTAVAPPIHPAGAHAGHAFNRPAVPPVFFAPPVFFNPLVPGFVTFAPPVVIVAPAPMPVHQPAVAAPPIVGIPVAPPVPPSDLFFAPPVRVVAPPPTGGQVLIIRRHSH